MSNTNPVNSLPKVVVFGDPYNGQAVGSIPSSKVDEICASGDSICRGTSSGSPGTVGTGHLSYGSDAGIAATFVVQHSGLSAS